MITQKIICDRCNKVLKDSEKKVELTDVFESMFCDGEQELGYVEINVVRLDGVVTRKLHLCEKCYDIAINALNKSC